MTDGSVAIFDPGQVRLHRERASRAGDEAGFLHAHLADGLDERLCDVVRVFPSALDIGARGGAASRVLARRDGTDRVVALERSLGFARRLAGEVAVGDAEALPFADGTFDLVVSLLDLHWVNDLPGALIQIRRALKPDGLFLAALPAGETLFELRAAMLAAEAETRGGASPRVSPFTTVADAGALLQRAGFALPVVDLERLTVTYADPFRLIADLRAMGETGAGVARDRRPPGRRFWARVAEIYAERFAEPDGRLPASFEFVWLAGWAPHESQPKALRPGSASGRLATALGVTEEKLPRP